MNTLSRRHFLRSSVALSGVLLGGARGTAHPDDPHPLLLAQANGQRSTVPSAYAALYAELEATLTTFERTLDCAHDGRRYPTRFGAALWVANAHRGTALLEPTALSGVALVLDRLRALGVTAVVLPILYPILHPFYDGLSTDVPPVDRSSEFLAFYTAVARLVRRRGMTLLVDTGPVFAGSTYSSLPISYATVTPAQWKDGLRSMVQTIISAVAPDYLTIASEPDTVAAVLGLPEVGTLAFYQAQAEHVLTGLVKGATKVGGGAGTWNDPRYVETLVNVPGIDFIDLHLYPVNRTMHSDYLLRAVELCDLATAHQKQIAVGEAWLYKIATAELGSVPAERDPRIFARDVFSFWQPLDQAFLRVLTKLARAYGFALIAPFWTCYLFAYLEYTVDLGKLPAETLLAQADLAALSSLLGGTVSPTGRYYQGLGTQTQPLGNTCP